MCVCVCVCVCVRAYNAHSLSSMLQMKRMIVFRLINVINPNRESNENAQSFLLVFYNSILAIQC